jgi:hypothetical protein
LYLWVAPAELPEPHRTVDKAESGGINELAQSGSSQTGQRDDGFVFALFPGSRLLCGQHDIGAGAAPHVIWQLYATDRPTSEVRGFYAGHTGKERAEAPAEVKLRVGKNLLMAYPASSLAYPRCGVEPKTTDKTVIVVSVLIPSDQ